MMRISGFIRRLIIANWNEDQISTGTDGLASNVGRPRQ